MTKSHFWPDRPIVIKVVAGADLSVFNAETILCHFLTKLHPFFTWEGKKELDLPNAPRYFWAPGRESVSDFFLLED